MEEIGVDMEEEFPKPLTDEVVRAADVVITMGCGDACPIYPGKRYEDWVLGDPAGQDLETVRRIRHRRRGSDVEDRNEFGAVPLDHPRSTLVAHGLPAEELLEDLAMRAHDRGVRKVGKEREQIVDCNVGSELPVTLDNEPAAGREWDDRLDAPCKGTRNDSRYVEIRERPDELTCDRAARLVEPPETVDLRRRQSRACARMSQKQHKTPLVTDLSPASAVILCVRNELVKG
jgi:hypothetical protein